MISTCTGRLATPASRGGGVEIGDLRRVVDAHPDPRGVRQRHQPAQFLPADDLVGDEHVAHAAIDHRLGLADLLHADPDRAELDLLQRDDRAFMRLGVRPQPHPAARRPARQALQIALERVEIDDQRRGIDLVERHADLGGRAGGHREDLLECEGRLAQPAQKCNTRVHPVSLLGSIAELGGLPLLRRVSHVNFVKLRICAFDDEGYQEMAETVPANLVAEAIADWLSRSAYETARMPSPTKRRSL